VDGDRLRVRRAHLLHPHHHDPVRHPALRIAVFALWPFGKTVVKRADAGVASGIGNVIWFVFCGWWLALGHLITGVALCITIIGIPLGLANFKLIPVSLLPLGRDIVSVDEARAMGAASAVAVPDRR
jgi:uncharacterized membrane protein YccF (DUF307 family)